MTLSTLVTRAYLLATGKATAPAATSNKYLKLVGLANVCQDMWQNEPDVEWDSLYLKVTLAGTVTATDTFALSATIREISKRPGDNVQIIHSDGNITNYEIVRANELQECTDNGIPAVARVGSNIVFSTAFTASSPQFGGRIKIPCYGFVSTLANDSDPVQVDNPLWLCYMLAAEYCRTDITLNYRTDDLVARANEVMTDMKQSQESSNPTPLRRPLSITRSW